MRSAGLAHTVIVVQSASKDGETATRRNRAQAHLDQRRRAAHSAALVRVCAGRGVA